MENIVYGLIQLNEVNELLQYELRKDNALLEDQKRKCIFEATQIFLEMLYAFVIITLKGISFSNFSTTAYTGICLTTAVSRAWNLYIRIYESQKLKLQLNTMYSSLYP
eukprot:TRINITY_DN1943_c0_g1_i12.p4 TRINITY_DN1943_c0_g1~~TRINITY_DN1943_c0_g1_i12.p4  ORF type:complete len:108 (+),score=29.68 TRINITY_DN1943_c0_g1_i12:803-1126(+)